VPAARSNGSFFGPTTLVELLRHRATHQASDRAFTYLLDGESEERSLTYGELDAQARRVAAWLQSAGAVGERVLLLYPSGLEYIAALFGCFYAGAVAVPAYPPRMNRTLERLQAIVEDAEPRFALTTTPLLGRIEQHGRGGATRVPQFEALRWLTTDQQGAEGSAWQEPAADGDTLAILQYTSGSTGTPKGVMLTHANLLHNSALIAHAFEHTRSGTGVFWLPGYHDMGLVGGILQPVYVGRPNVLMSPLAFLQRPLRWLQAISRYGATTSGGPNFAYELCLRKVADEALPSLDLSRWQVAFNGAEPVRAETLEAFAQRFGRCGFRREAFYPCYGLAEATLLAAGGYVSAAPIIRHVDRAAIQQGRVVDLETAKGQANRGKETSPLVRPVVGCGHSLPDQDLTIVNPAKRTRCSDDEVGEIWLRGPSVAQGYWRRPAETRETFEACLADSAEGPYLRTGDLGFLREGELFVTGRIKDVIIVHGQNHDPHDIERSVAESHPALRGMSGAAFLLEEEGHQCLIVLQEIRRSRRREADEAIMAIRRHVPSEHGIAPAEIVLVRPGAIAKTTSGKIQRHVCQRAFVKGRLPIVARWKDAQTGSAVRNGKPAPLNQHALNGHARCHDDSISGLKQFEAAARLGRSDANRRLAVDDRSATADQRAGHESPDAAAVPQRVLAEVRRIARPPEVHLTLESPLADAGLDSLGRMELLATLEGALGSRLPETFGQDVHTIMDLAEAIEQHLTQSPPSAAATTYSPEHFDLAHFPEWTSLRRDAQRLELLGAGNPYFLVQEPLGGRRVWAAGRELIDFASYDYLGLSDDPRVIAAAQAAIERYGTSVSGSRLVSGERPLHRELEEALADWVGAEDALVLVSGHATNVTTIGHLLGPSDLVLHDALAHNSIVEGCRLSGARRLAFPHNDAEALDRLLTSLRGHYRRALVAIEGLYSMDGDVPDLPRFIEIKERHQAMLLVDEAHSLGVLGEQGRGIGEHYKLGTGSNAGHVDLWMGTLSKALASCGGYIAGRRELVEYLRYTAPGFVYSVGISPANTAAALEALRVLAAEPPRVRTLHERAADFLGRARARSMELGVADGSPIIPVVVGDAATCLQVWQALVDRGVLAQPILPPAVPSGSARLRFFVSAEHTTPQISQAVDAISDELRRVTRESLTAAAG